jgi:putative membrane protein
MKLKRLLVVLSLACASLFTATIVTAAENQSKDHQHPTANTVQPNVKDGEVLKTLVVLNTNEVDAGKLAAEKATDKKVKQFADQMQKDHSKNMEATKALAKNQKIDLVDSNASNSLQEEGKNELQNLKSTDKKDFDKEYIDMMVKGHEKAAQTIEKELLPNASNPTVANHLKATLKTVKHHLQMAKNTQKALENKKS